MNEALFPIRLREARLQQGYSLNQLVKKAGLSISRQSLYRYEKGEMLPKADVISDLAKVFGVAESYFLGNSLQVDIPMLRSTKGYKFSSDEESRLEAKLCFWAEHYLKMEHDTNLQSSFNNPLNGMSIATLNDAIHAANKLRSVWNCGDGPIASILRLIERKGIKIFNTSLPNGIYGLSTWADHSHPLMILDMRLEKTTVERLRFTAAHELAHLLLSFTEDSQLTIEKRCDKFAGFFLFPKNTFIEEMGGEKREFITLEEMIDLKQIYGLSIAAQVRTAYDIGMITPEHYHWWFEEKIDKNIQENGWGSYPFPETIGRERRIEAVLARNYSQMDE